MNLSLTWKAPSKLLFRIMTTCRMLLPRKRSKAFGTLKLKNESRIERIYAINLIRQPVRWVELEHELRNLLDWSGTELWNLTSRYEAVDAQDFPYEIPKDSDVDPIYTLGEQLFVEPQPLSLPSQLDLSSPIRMSNPEVAVARSHIDIWRQVAAGQHKHVLIIEDDVWFQVNFASKIDQVWDEIKTKGGMDNNFDILYLSYQEVKHGAPKTFFSDNVFRPVKGLWFLSGYVLSRKGAKKLIGLLPCRGPVDLWINHKFDVLDVLAIRLPIIKQRRNGSSTNSYSILPSLTKIGAITSEGASSFNACPIYKPVFVFGSEGSGLTSLAMALSMLGYRCCSDLQELPGIESEMFFSGVEGRLFDAYVNIGTLTGEVKFIREHYPQAKFIVTTSKDDIASDNFLSVLDNLDGADVAVLRLSAPNKWQIVCEHLRCVPPACSFPESTDLGQRPLLKNSVHVDAISNCETPKHDKSPWVVESHPLWKGINTIPLIDRSATEAATVKFSDSFETLDADRWFQRNDTFTDNLALFRPSNIEFQPASGVSLNIRKESLGVREYSAAALTSCDQYLYGRFEAMIKASNAPGVITGFFLHRDSPRQEIDVEIVGNNTDRLMVNVFYNPGGEGAKFDFGYRGSPSYIDLGFDASESEHHFAIEWEPNEIRWYVDNLLVHKRVIWEPTPIPHLPMALHVNVWPSRSKELAGRLTKRTLPTTTFINSIAVKANRHLRSPIE